jgi:hypothetical protein
MILVADCSALIALASCDGLRLLDALFGTVVVPEAVYREAVVGGKPEAQELKEYLRDKVKKIDLGSSVLLDGFSDIGETAASRRFSGFWRARPGFRCAPSGLRAQELRDQGDGNASASGSGGSQRGRNDDHGPRGPDQPGRLVGH